MDFSQSLRAHANGSKVLLEALVLVLDFVKDGVRQFLDGACGVHMILAGGSGCFLLGHAFQRIESIPGKPLFEYRHVGIIAE